MAAKRSAAGAQTEKSENKLRLIRKPHYQKRFDHARRCRDCLFRQAEGCSAGTEANRRAAKEGVTAQVRKPNQNSYGRPKSGLTLDLSMRCRSSEDLSFLRSQIQWRQVFLDVSALLLKDLWGATSDIRTSVNGFSNIVLL